MYLQGMYIKAIDSCGWVGGSWLRLDGAPTVGVGFPRAADWPKDLYDMVRVGVKVGDMGCATRTYRFIDVIIVI
jgi:hypothetical protein